MKRLIGWIWVSLSLVACEHPFGDKTDLGFIDVPDYSTEPVAFVPIQPVIYEAAEPVDILAGFDELIYVADAANDRIIAFDQSGRKLGSCSLPGVKALAQDRSLNILAIGKVDTMINGTNFSLDAVYRLDLQGSAYGIAHATVIKKIIHPFYMKTSFSASDADVKLNRISVMADGRYYVTRTGPSNNPNQIGGPDDAVLVFDAADKFVTTVNVTTDQGLISDYFKEPFAITTLAKPPQSNFVNMKGDFIFTSLSPNTALKVQYISYNSSEFGSSYTLNTAPAVMDTSRAEGFLYTPDRFAQPCGVTVTGDGSNYIFVSDAGKDSVYLFTITGQEGVNPPPGNASKKQVRVSFGGKGNSLKQFNRPMGLAYHRKILYVCDAGNGRILRFKLTTDF